MAKRRDFEDVYVHCFLDGRDTSPTSGKGFMEELEQKAQSYSWLRIIYKRFKGV